MASHGMYQHDPCAAAGICMYDTSDRQYYAAYKADSWLVLPDYVNFVSQLEKLSS